MTGSIPLERGLRLGPAEIVKGGARVIVRLAEQAVETGAGSVPVAPEAQAAETDLFRPRLIEFGETRQETVVAAMPVVREELVVGRSVERRVERIEEKVRRTEVEVDDLPPSTGKNGI